MDKLNVIETFLSLEGEGARIGAPVVFVRFAECNLRCSYCDTTYSYDKADSVEVTRETLTREIMSYGCKLITFTGGEPLLNESSKEYIAWFMTQYPDYEVNIETNGSVEIGFGFGLYQSSSIITMDYKCPSSGMTDKMLVDNLEKLRYDDVLKFVVGTEEDLTEVLRVLTTYNIIAKIYVSPVFGQMDLQRLAKFVIDNRHFNIKLNVQLHKIIWDPNKRGV